MASVITQSVAAVIIGKSFSAQKHSAVFWCGLIACSLLPDIDVIGFRFGIAYGDFWGHRGFTHSLFFAAITGLLVGLLFFRRLGFTSLTWWRYVVLFAIVTASNGVFDAMTNGGLGVAFFSPFDDTRHFLEWRPVQVTRVGFYDFFSMRGLKILASEVMFILAPLFTFAFILVWSRKKLRRL